MPQIIKPVSCRSNTTGLKTGRRTFVVIRIQKYLFSLEHSGYMYFTEEGGCKSPTPGHILRHNFKSTYKYSYFSFYMKRYLQTEKKTVSFKTEKQNIVNIDLRTFYLRIDHKSVNCCAKYTLDLSLCQVSKDKN